MLQVEEPSSGGGGMPSSGAPGDEEGYQLIKIHVPELNVQKCLQFSRDQLVWDVKQQCLASLPKVANWYRELKESFNYGLFSPPVNGKAGKFLDEERRLGDYPFSGPVGYLELKYKRRVYKMMSLDEKQLKSLHTRANLRRLLDYVQNGQVEKITKVCSKGLDPNFHCQDSGETPLTIAATVKKPAKVLIALVNGGALLDYRTRDGSTAMHRAVEKNSLEAVRTLLELGASPNYRDSKGLTPLYLCITTGADPAITETLLHDHATIGAQDLHGWQEVHQACKNGLRQHLEHLLFYGADMNARNASGNTPLHMCAVNGQEPCARQLLFRGADRDALNYANQTPYQVAVIAGNLDLAELIQNYRPEDVVPFRGPPSYNPKRRSGFGFCWLPRAPSERCLILPPSPCPSDRSSAPTTFSSASDSLSGSEGSSHHGVPHGHETDTASIVTVLALGVADKSLGDTSDIISDSSGVGTANSDTTNCSLSMPGTTVVCIENYSSNLQGHLRISEGDIIEVTGATDCGLLEGTLRGPGQHSGLFPAQCVQEVRLRHGIPPPMMITARDRPPSRVVGRRETITKHFATAPRVKAKTNDYSLPAEPRTVVLHRARKGFGFILRGAKATSPLMELIPSEKCPALQYLDDVDKGGVADMSGLKKGDFLLEINGEDVTSASHEHVVDLIRKSGDLVSMTVVSLSLSLGPPQIPGMLPMSKSAAALPANVNSNGSMDVVPLNRQCATLPRKLPNSQSQSGNLGTLGKARAPMPPRRDPKTTLSVGRARAKSMVAGLEGGGEKEDLEDMTTAKSSSAESIHQQVTPGGTCTSTPVQPRTASIRARPTSSRITAAELEELFQRQQDGTARDRASGMMTTSHFQGTPASPAKGKVYASVAEMKRSKGKSSSTSRGVRFFNTLRRGSAFVPVSGELHRDFHSTPDLAHQEAMAFGFGKGHRSQEDVTLGLGNRPLPPPSHPPPPPPIGQVVKVDVSRASKSEYDSIAAKGDQFQFHLMHDEGVMSSFRPAASAKLYASPEDMKTVGYRSRSLPSHSARPQVRKSHSLRTNASSFKPKPKNNTTTPPAAPTPTIMSATLPKNSGGSNSNPYAQPIRASRSHSTKKQRLLLNNSNSNVQPGGGPPPIPEPDYSLSESEMESEEERDRDIKNSELDLEKGVQRLNLNIVQQPVETSGNSNASGSSGSSGSSSMQHSFSVDEIQKVRTQLKSSKSYPNDFLLKQKKQDEALPEDCDNSSSGVSSDQEIPPIPPSNFDDHHHHHKTLITASQTGTLRNSHSHSHSHSHHNQRVRNAVSLAQLPPPIEADTDEKEDIFVPPPPEFEGGGGPSGTSVAAAAAVVLAPPPQFSDHRQTRVRIVGAVPKSGKSGKSGQSGPSTVASNSKSGRLHSQ